MQSVAFDLFAHAGKGDGGGRAKSRVVGSWGGICMFRQADDELKQALQLNVSQRSKGSVALSAGRTRGGEDANQ